MVFCYLARFAALALGIVTPKVYSVPFFWLVLIAVLLFAWCTWLVLTVYAYRVRVPAQERPVLFNLWELAVTCM